MPYEPGFYDQVLEGNSETKAQREVTGNMSKDGNRSTQNRLGTRPCTDRYEDSMGHRSTDFVYEPTLWPPCTHILRTGFGAEHQCRQKQTNEFRAIGLRLGLVQDHYDRLLFPKSATEVVMYFVSYIEFIVMSL